MASTNTPSLYEKVHEVRGNGPAVSVQTGPAPRSITLPTLHASVFKQDVQRARIRVEDVELLVENEDSVELTLLLKSDDPQHSHAVECTVNLLSLAGTALANARKTSASIDPHGTAALTFRFERPHLLNQYVRHTIVVRHKGG